MKNISKRISQLLLNIPPANLPFLRLILHGFEITACMHDARGGHIRSIFGIPVIWDWCHVDGAHETLSQLVNAVINVNGVYE
jgi:hypothetical protein